MFVVLIQTGLSWFALDSPYFVSLSSLGRVFFVLIHRFEDLRQNQYTNAFKIHLR